MFLQQHTAFTPFVQQFVSFTQVARRTSQHNIADIVYPSSRQGDNVVSMVRISPSGKFCFAVIATTMLLSIQPPELAHGMRTNRFCHACAPQALVISGAIPVGLCMLDTPHLILLASIFAMSGIPISGSRSCFFSLNGLGSLASLANADMFPMGKLPFKALSNTSFPMSRIICSPSGYLTGMLFWLFACLCDALFALPLQSIRGIWFSVKKISGCEFSGFASRAILKAILDRWVYPAGHLPTPLVSALISALPGSQGHFSSRGFMRPSLGNISILPFFTAQQKTERMVI